MKATAAILALCAGTALATTCSTSASNILCYSGTNEGSAAPFALAANTPYTVTCSSKGQDINGNSNWYFYSAKNCYISAATVTCTGGPVLACPTCS